MPFTFAHAAAGLPFKRVPLAWSAFFIGCFAPDFEYFLLLAPQNGYGHHWPGILTLTLPIAFAAFVLYEVFVRELLVSLLPPHLQTRIPPSNDDFRWQHLLLVFASLVLGVATHIFWDGFTHDSGWAAQMWPQLHHPVILPMVGARSVANILQWISSCVGLLLLLWWGRSVYRTRRPAYPVRSVRPSNLQTAAVLAMIVAVILSVIRALNFVGSTLDQHNVRRFFILVTIDVIAIFWWFLLAAGILRRFTLRQS